CSSDLAARMSSIGAGANGRNSLPRGRASPPAGFISRPRGVPMPEPLLRASGLARYFDVSPPWLNRVLERKPRAVLKAVDGVDFEIGRGETFSLVGESGCGKSTVARLAVGLYRPTRGRIEFDGTDLATVGSRRAMLPLRRRLQMIFQDPYASLNPRWRVREIIAEPLRTHR